MNALFAPFRKRDLNPLHYDNKMKFWKELIAAYCKEKQIIQVDIVSLECFFSRKKIKPKCLEPVLNELIKDGSFKTQSEILKPKPGKNSLNKKLNHRQIKMPKKTTNTTKLFVHLF